MPFALNTIRGKCQTIKRQLAESSRVPAAANQKARGPEKGVASYVKALLNVSSACQRGWNGTRNQEKGERSREKGAEPRKRGTQASRGSQEAGLHYALLMSPGGEVGKLRKRLRSYGALLGGFTKCRYLKEP